MNPKKAATFNFLHIYFSAHRLPINSALARMSSKILEKRKGKGAEAEKTAYIGLELAQVAEIKGLHKI